MTYLADINVWLALTFSAHPHHDPAVAWFDGLSPPHAGIELCLLGD